MTLSEFLLARITEDEARARFRQHQDIRAHRVKPHDGPRRPDDPWRVLGECALKRKLIEEGDERAARLLALSYADHPDYREEWSI